MTELIPSGTITNGQFILGQRSWVEDAVTSVTVRGDQTPQGDMKEAADTTEISSASGQRPSWVWVSVCSLCGRRRTRWLPGTTGVGRGHGLLLRAKSRRLGERHSPAAAAAAVSGRNKFKRFYAHVVVWAVVPRWQSGFLIWSTSLHSFYRNVSDSWESNISESWQVTSIASEFHRLAQDP